MKAGLVAGVVALTAILGACSTDRKLTRPDPEPIDAELIETGLLTAEDLPASFTAVDDADPVNTDIIPEHDCDDDLLELEAEETAAAQFDGPSSTLRHTVSYFPGNGGAVEQLIRNIVSACSQVVVADEGLSIRALSLDFGVLTDDTYAVRFEIEPSSGPIEERDLILRREGDLVSIIRLDGPRPSDKTLLDTAVRTTIGRVGLIALRASGR